MAAKTQSVTILHTNDIHSHFERMSPIAALMDGQRAAAEGAVLMLDIGDHMDRAAAETEGTRGQANIDILNLTGYDAVTIGNNEGLTFSSAELERLYAGLHCPVVCCNFLESATGEPPVWMKRSTVIDKDGVRIGITGATAPFHTYYALLGWEALEPEEALREQVEQLAPQSDIIVILSHLGLAADRELAAKLNGVHAILGGHTHHVLEEPLLINGTAVCGAGKFGRLVGSIRFEREPDGGPFRYAGGRCLPVDPDRLNERVALAGGILLDRAREALDETIAVTDRELPLDLAGDSPFSNLLAQAVRRFTGSQFALVNAGQLLGPLPKGRVTAGMLHALCPSPINPCTMKLKGSDVRRALEQSRTAEYRDKIVYGYGFRGERLGGLAVDGLNILSEQGPMPYDERIAVFVDGQPLEDEAEYTVGTLDMFTFRAGYETIGNGREVAFMLPHFLRSLLAMELKRPGSLETCAEPRFRSALR
ncbi:bifunctional metallophosphatase/5'-nucleotidase [Paenibacillus glufosinatiresistens]|uniref:bifunctional metallophosphatase/5'-nucleotidase n=1 Tax=Paenibacillus glufosinatiresistens TaxID=3070657 RepID=UPI00286D8D2B|nr:bifunctional UDP-sugar hydrolase/5'-nucleotidase [Paenibacillus sp. YX.27]